MKIAIYARISTTHNGQDPETQLLPLREYARARGFEVYQEYIDITSGIKESRPNLDILLNEAKKRRFDAVVVWKLDRLGRSLKHLITLIDEFQSLGIQFISYTEGMDTTTPAGKLLFNVIGAIAGFERDLIRERVKAGLNNAKNKGKRLGRPNIKVDYETIKNLKQSGASLRHMATELHISKSTLARALSQKPVRNVA